MGDKPDTSRVIPLAPADGAATDGIRRREALQVILGAGALALPHVVEAQHPIHQHLAGPGIERAQQKAAASAYSPEFLDAHQLKTLEVLAEAIVPGSTTARVAPFLDQLLAVESQQTQKAFLGSLGAFDMAAIARHRKAWTAIAAADQDRLLREASTADPKTTAIAGHFQNLKDWIVGAYYSSEPGMRELGWDGNNFHQELPGCTHPGGHA